MEGIGRMHRKGTAAPLGDLGKEWGMGGGEWGGEERDGEGEEGLRKEMPYQ